MIMQHVVHDNASILLRLRVYLDTAYFVKN